MDDVVGDDARRRPHRGNVVVVDAPIEPERELLLQTADGGQAEVVAARVNLAAAAHREEVLHHAGVHVRVARDEVDRVPEGIQRDVVAGAGDQHVLVGRQRERVRIVLLARRRDVLQREHLVAIEQVGVLEADADAVVPGLGRAGVVEPEAEPPGTLVLDAHLRRQVALVRAALQHGGGLLDRALVGESQLACEPRGVERLPLGERGQAAADVGRVEVAVPFDAHAAHAPFDRTQSHHPSAISCSGRTTCVAP